MLEVLTVSALEDVNLGVVYFGIHMMIYGTIVGAQVFGAGGTLTKLERDEQRDSQCRCPLRTKFTVENQDSLLRTVSTNRRFRFSQAGTPQEQLIDLSGRIYINGAFDMPTVVLIVEAAIDDVELMNTRVINAIQEIVDLKTPLYEEPQRRKEDAYGLWSYSHQSVISNTVARQDFAMSFVVPKSR
jgi:hypothetical protein